MAEPTTRYFAHKRQVSLMRTAARIDGEWPGGTVGAISDYLEGRTTLRHIQDKCGVHFRAVRNLFDDRRVPLHDAYTTRVIARKLNPLWNENISRTKLLKPFRHTPEVTAAATAKRIETVTTDPSRHGNAHQRMSSREHAFSELLTRHGVAFHFNQPAAGFWLDFYLPDLRVGIEVQKPSRLPSLERAAEIRRELNLRVLLYVPNIYFFNGNIGYLDSLVWTLKRDTESIGPTIGDACWLCQKQADVDARWYGFGFKRRWAAETPTGNLPIGPTQDRAEDTQAGSL